MSASISSSITSGSVVLAKPTPDTLVQVQVSGTYSGLSFVIEGSIDGTNFVGLGALQNDTRSLVTGTITPASNATIIYDVRAAGYQKVQARITALASGSPTFTLQSNVFLAAPEVVPANSVPSTLGSAGGTLSIAGLIAESSTAGITANAGGGQTSAVALTTEINRVATVASRSDSVKLPPSAAGLGIIVINTGAQPLAVFPATGDAINGQAANASVLIPPNAVDLFVCPQSGQWYAEVGVGFSGQLFTELSQDGITAFAGGGQGSATQLTAQTNRVTTVASRGDSVKLPVSAPGLEIIVINTGANPLAVFPSTGDAINGQAANASVVIPPNAIDIFACPIAGQWYAEVGVGFSGQLFTELAQDNITANPGGGQAGAFQLTAQTNRITTVATAGDSIKLPASAPGLELMVINHGANPMQVYGSGTDTIDDVAAATGVSQMANSLVIYTCATAGAWYTEGLATGFAAAGLQTISFADNLTARAGGGQGLATALTSMVNRVTTVATAGDSVALPAAAAGLVITVINRTSNPMQVFGAGTDTINGIATATGVSQPPNSVCTYTCGSVGKWETNGVAQGFAGGLTTVSTSNGIVANPGGGQGGAVALTAEINRVTTVGTSGDSVKLPAAVAGLQITVYNAGANSLNVFPNTGDAINALGANTAFAVAAGKNATFGCAVAGQYHAILSA